MGGAAGGGLGVTRRAKIAVWIAGSIGILLLMVAISIATWFFLSFSYFPNADQRHAQLLLCRAKAMDELELSLDDVVIGPAVFADEIRRGRVLILEGRTNTGRKFGSYCQAHLGDFNSKAAYLP